MVPVGRSVCAAWRVGHRLNVALNPFSRSSFSCRLEPGCQLVRLGRGRRSAEEFVLAPGGGGGMLDPAAEALEDRTLLDGALGAGSLDPGFNETGLVATQVGKTKTSVRERA